MVTYFQPVDAVFKAIAEPIRRDILDALVERDGRTVSDLEGTLGVTRFVVMKHLRILEEASLVTSRKEGRFRYVHLNAAPVQMLADRWIAPIVRPYAQRLADLKRALEGESNMTVETDFRLETYIKTTPERLWRALTDPKDTANYYFGSRVESDWNAGSHYTYRGPDGSILLDGEVIEAAPPKRLVTSFRPHWTEGKARVTRVTYLIEPLGEVCKLTLIHEGLTEAEQGIRAGWVKITDSLKTLLETGKALPLPRAS